MTIQPRPGRVGQTNRGPVAVGKQQTSQPVTFPAPKGGLVTTRDMASQEPGTASVLRNFFPTLTGCRIRGGSQRTGLAADGTDLLSAFKYKYGAAEKMFMASATAIYDMTSPAAPPTTTAADVSGMSGGDWCAFQHTNAGTSYLVCLNGANDRQLYNGTTWTTSPAITFSDSTTMPQLNCGWLFKNREFFLKNGTLDAYYLAVNAVGGAASLFPLGGVMKKGGSLLTGFSWSLESGDGLNDMCVFVSTEGEIAVYAGDDPSSASSFALKGVYQIGKPLGKNAWIRAGGDILIATTDGLTPMSQVFQRDRQALSLVSASRPIEDDWRKAANATGTGWTLKQWPEQNLVFVAFPENSVVTDTTFVLNVLTGKWATVTNWKALCYDTLQGGLFFGSLDGYVWQGDTTGTDDGLTFSATYLSQFSPAGQFGQRANATLAHMYFRAKTKPKVRLFARADYDKSTPSFNAATEGDAASSEWDVGLWDVAIWDGVSEVNRYDFRQNVRASGDMLAVGCVITSGGDFKLDLEVDLATVQVSVGEASA
ncbi:MULTISPECIES: hypothetical protein [unclassified Sinorhizobium]|uniref:hypothetical protein n=1 Tax=unclassified Sinorhizobium TaxID=2613772 RepID=UPI0024C327A7|nr:MULTISPECIES: hypothetical protein [unclassified Sinorhizobium]MDK1377095.1 hypothetical protein [Sinorhizobium sp. 6-70]MDK1479610.1 hypothetical protein [Sinorhizobium sp. 6-117]